MLKSVTRRVNIGPSTLPLSRDHLEGRLSTPLALSFWLLGSCNVNGNTFEPQSPQRDAKEGHDHGLPAVEVNSTRCVASRMNTAMAVGPRHAGVFDNWQPPRFFGHAVRIPPLDSRGRKAENSLKSVTNRVNIGPSTLPLSRDHLEGRLSTPLALSFWLLGELQRQRHVTSLSPDHVIFVNTVTRKNRKVSPGLPACRGHPSR
jgi:hypothetical protein